MLNIIERWAMFQSYNFYYQRGSHSDRTITEAQHWKGGLVVMKRTQLERRPALFLAPFLKKSAEDETKTKTDGGKRPRAENCWRRANIRYQMDTQVGSSTYSMSFCLPLWMDLFHPAERFGRKKITADRCGDDQKLHLAPTISFNEC